MSLGLGLAAAFLLYAGFLQTSLISGSRLALALIAFISMVLAHYLIGEKMVVAAIERKGLGPTRILVLAFVVSAMFLPLAYASPRFPISPLLQPWTDLAVQYEVSPSAPPLVLSENDVRLKLETQTLNSSAFQRVGEWVDAGGALHLAPSGTAALRWTGTVPSTAVLSITPPSSSGTLTIYWDGSRSAIPLREDGHEPIVITRKFAFPVGYDLAIFLSLLVVSTSVLTALGLLLGRRLAPILAARGRGTFMLMAIVLALGLGALNVALQIGSLRGGLSFVTGTQWLLHTNVLAGRAPDPWQYRVFSEWLAEAFVRLGSLLSIPNAVAVGFIGLRLLQNLAILLLGFALYRRFGASDVLAVLGLLLLAASMATAFYDNDLSFNTYSDLLFYLFAALLLLADRTWWVVALTLAAALNRETGALIPFMLGAALFLQKQPTRRKNLLPFFVSVGIFALVFFGLRFLVPGRPLYVPYKHPLGTALLQYNLTREFTWAQLFGTLGVIPLLAVLAIPRSPRIWRAWFLIVVPIWFAVHSLAGVMAETRLFLVPQAIIFIPGALFLLDRLARDVAGMDGNPDPTIGMRSI